MNNAGAGSRVDNACASRLTLADERSATELQAEFIVRTEYRALPAAVRDRANVLVLDLIGVALAGSRLSLLPAQILAELESVEGKPEARTFHGKSRLPAANAAFANASFAHALDMDDAHRFGALHPGAVVIPAALAAAETSGASTEDLLAGIICGYEVGIRVGSAVNPSSVSRGFHTTGTAGPLAAAAAAAKVMRLDVNQTASALGFAALQGAGLLEVNLESGMGGEAKVLSAARASNAGVFSAALASRSAIGPRWPLEGPNGFLGAFADDHDEHALTAGLGKQFEISRTYIKLHASGRHSHACIDAACAALRSGGVEVRDIAKIDIETYPAAVRLTASDTPDNGAAARFSIVYAVAIALATGDAAPERFADATVREPSVQRLAQTISLTTSQKWADRYPNDRGATVAITTTDGAVWSADCPLARGEPENPASQDEIIAKFHINAGALMSRVRSDALAELILRLQDHSLDELWRAIRGGSECMAEDGA